ncbi:unnamed protein product, partial [Rotaria magnacalcarata]
MPKRAVGIKRSWEELKKELDRTGSGYPGAVYFKTISAQGPQLFAIVNNDSVFYNDHGKWHRYITACNIQFGRMEFNSSNPDRSKSEDTISQLQTNESDWVFISHNGQDITYHYHELVVPLLHRMAHLEKLTLYLHINTDGLLINDTHLQNEILIHMPQLHTFTFYISIEIGACKLPRSISPDDIQKTSTNIKSIRTACVIESLNRFTTMCHAYLFPFSFTHLNISSQFPNMILNSVTHLYVKDSISLKHRFVMRISKAFPMLMCFSLRNSTTQLCNDHAMTTDENLSNLIIEYPQLILLDLRYVNEDYVEQFLLETKIYLPRLTQRRV